MVRLKVHAFGLWLEKKKKHAVNETKTEKKKKSIKP